MTPAVDLEFAEVEVPAAFAVRVPGRCSADPAALSSAIQTAFGALMGFLGHHRLAAVAPPRVVYTDYGAQGCLFFVAMPIAPPPDGLVLDPPVTAGALDGSRAYRFTHHGPYTNLMQTYGQITAFMKSKGWIENDADWARYMPMWEEYLNDPEKTPPSELLTYIYLPIPTI